MLSLDQELTPEILLQAYAVGIFPMAEGRTDPTIHWVDPRRRGILPLDGFVISRSLARRLRQARFAIRIDSDFEAVVAACADRPETWISEAIQRHYVGLHARGHAHSIEVWDGPRLVGGVYGVTLGAAFFGESMFSRVTDASKIALAHTVQRLRAGGFQLFDTQFLTPHLARLGGVEISREHYRAALAAALGKPASFPTQAYWPGEAPGADSGADSGAGSGESSGWVQARTQTS